MQLGRFELVGKIGEGAHGIVWLAHDPKLDREVAIKVLQPDMAADETVQHRFRREMKSIARLRHPNIIELVDFSDPDAEWPYIVLERLMGETLLSLIEAGGPLEPVAAAAAGHEICLALEHAHATGIVHRDLKPENIFLEPSGRIVLCDFGIAVGFLKDESVTMSGKNTKLLGSPLFMSPEQILAEATIGPSTDLFSLGSVLFFLVTGNHAFAEESVLGVLKRISAGQPHPLPPEIADSRLGRIIGKLLSLSPADRYPSADAVAEELLLVLQEGGLADARRALKQTLSSMVRPVEVKSVITAIADLDRTSKTLITKVVQGKPVDWDEVTNVEFRGSSQTSIVDLGSLTQSITVTQPVSGNTQINTPLMRLGDDETSGGEGEGSRTWLIALIAVVIVCGGIGSAWLWVKTRPKPVPPVLALTPPLPEPAPVAAELIPQPTPEAVPVVPAEPAPEPAPALDPPPPNKPPPSPKPPPNAKAPAPQKPTPPPKPPPPAPKPVAAGAKSGVLRIIAKPWAYVHVDGLEVGQTPTFREISLQAGKHKVKLTNPEIATVTREVEIKSGEETKLKVDLENP